VFILNVLLFREAPPTPPSFSSSQPREPFLKSMPILFKDKEFIKLLIVFLLLAGGLNSFGINLEAWMKPFGFKSADVSALAGASVFTGFMGTGVLAQYIRKTRKFKLAMNLLTLLGGISLTAI
jgi:MFS transporter, FLVCR family, feline leukemia virus subgroup C receptor-related protein